MQDSFQAETGWERPKKNEKKIFVPIRSLPTQARKFQKKLKNIILASFEAKMGREGLRKRERKNFFPIRSYPTRTREFQ